MRFIIAIDLGTTHIKAVIVNHQAKPFQTFKLPVVSVQNESGKYGQDAEVIFQSVLTLLKQSFQVVNQGDIACVVFSAAMHSILAVSKDGTPFCKALTWADTQSKAYAQHIKSIPAGESIYKQTGTPIHAMSPLCKIVWIKNERPEMFAKAQKFISVKEYIFHRLFGKYIVDFGIASASGLFDIYNLCWHKEALEFAGIDESKLSQVVSATHFETALLESIKSELNLKLSIPFVTGGNDGCLANLGCGALNKDEAALTVGTSGAVRVTIPKPLPAALQGLFRYMLTNELNVTGGPINNGGIALQWFAENFLNISIGSSEDFNQIMQLASKAPAASNGLIFLPYLLGERAPVWDEDAKGMFYGLQLIHRKEHLTRAIIEGISYSLLQILTAIEKINGTVKKVFVSGIVTQSEWWMQLLADMFGKTIVLNESADASAMGAAFVGMYATGMIDDLSTVKSFMQITKTFEADANIHAIYQKHFEVYASLYPRFKQK